MAIPKRLGFRLTGTVRNIINDHYGFLTPDPGTVCAWVGPNIFFHRDLMVHKDDWPRLRSGSRVRYSLHSGHEHPGKFIARWIEIVDTDA